LLSQSDAKVEEVPEKPIELNAALSTVGAQNVDEQARAEQSIQTPVSAIVDQATSAKTKTLKFTGNVSFGRTVTIVPTGDIEVDVQSNKGGAAAFGLLGAIVEEAATSEASQSDETVISQYVTGSESGPRKRFAALLAEYLGSCFSETEAYTSVVQPLLGAKAWRLKDKRLDETRYEVVPSTNFIVDRLHESKGLEDLVEAFRLVYPAHPFRFVACGAGPLEDVSKYPARLCSATTTDFLVSSQAQRNKKSSRPQTSLFYPPDTAKGCRLPCSRQWRMVWCR